MNRLTSLLVLLLGLALPSEGNAAPTIQPIAPSRGAADLQEREAYASTRLRLRTSPDPDAEVVTTIPRGSRVAVGSCSDGWCQVRYRGRNGYSAERYLDDDRPSEAVIPTGRGYTNSRGEWVRSPVYARSAPAGASARCRDGTYSFSRSRRGTCSRHGGVAEWL